MKQKQISKQALKTFQKFQGKQGSNQIATRRALEILGHLILEKKPKIILEIGSGIGTITSFIFDISAQNYKIQKYFAYEKNAWGKEKFLINLAEVNFKNIVKQISNLKNISSLDWVDLIVIDDRIEAKDYEFLLEKAASQSIIFIEGHRFPQRLEIIKVLGRKKIKFSYKGFIRSKHSYKGAAVFYINKKSQNSIAYTYLLRKWVSLLMAYMFLRSIRSRISVRKMFR